MDNETKLENYKSKYDDFAGAFLPHLWDKVMYWFWLHKILRAKKLNLYEGFLDKSYFEVEFADVLSYNDEADRNLLIAEQSKPDSEQDQKKIEELEHIISRAKAVKTEYRRVNEFIANTQNYINVVKAWRGSLK